ncbi:CRAL/TRIO domain-containing protein [Poronia punctata]|nr:CRAL/TRIO domain-containing protein [Poronia punctata]
MTLRVLSHKSDKSETSHIEKSPDMAVSKVSPGTLGNLTPEEEKKLQQAWVHLLRLSGVTDLDKLDEVPDLEADLRPEMGDIPTTDKFRRSFWEFAMSEHPDALVLRFLRARKWDVPKAMAMLVSAVNWRVQRNISGTIVRTGESVALKAAEEQSEDDKGFISQYRSGKSYVRSTDRENRLVYIIRVKYHDPRAQSGDSMESYVLHNIENLRILLRPPEHKCCLIFDLTNFGLKNMDFHVVKFLITVFEARYPETLGLVLIHNAPFVFWGIWNMIKGWLDPVIASKINFTRKTADLLKFIPEENLQSFYGGKDKWEYEYIEPVPGENARLEEAEKREEIDKQRDVVIRDFERETVEWATKGLGDTKEDEKADKRNDLAEQVTDSYWKLDPYIRSTTYFHRLGLMKRSEHVGA